MARLIGLAAGLLTVAVACASPDTLDGLVLSEELPAAVSPDAPADVTEVVCPEEPPRGLGLVARCTAVLGVDPIGVDVTQIDEDGSVSMAVLEPLLDVAEVEQQARQRFAADGFLDAPVRCEGSRLRVLEAPVTLQCESQEPTDFDRRFRAIVAVDGTFAIALGAGESDG